MKKNFADYADHEPILVSDLLQMPEMKEKGLLRKEFNSAVTLGIITTTKLDRRIAVEKHQVRKFFEWARKKRLEDAEAMSLP